jgi:hypothetical protein
MSAESLCNFRACSNASFQYEQDLKFKVMATALPTAASGLLLAFSVGEHRRIVNSMVPSTVAYSQDPPHTRSIFTMLFATFFWRLCPAALSERDLWRSELPQGGRRSM